MMIQNFPNKIILTDGIMMQLNDVYSSGNEQLFLVMQEIGREGLRATQQ